MNHSSGREKAVREIGVREVMYNISHLVTQKITLKDVLRKVCCCLVVRNARLHIYWVLGCAFSGPFSASYGDPKLAGVCQARHWALWLLVLSLSIYIWINSWPTGNLPVCLSTCQYRQYYRRTVIISATDKKMHTHEQTRTHVNIVVPHSLSDLPLPHFFNLSLMAGVSSG